MLFCSVIEALQSYLSRLEEWERTKDLQAFVSPTQTEVIGMMKPPVMSEEYHIELLQDETFHVN